MSRRRRPDYCTGPRGMARWYPMVIVASLLALLVMIMYVGRDGLPTQLYNYNSNSKAQTDRQRKEISLASVDKGLLLHEQLWYQTNCWPGKEAASLATIGDTLALLRDSEHSKCRDLHQMFTRIYSVSQRSGSVFMGEALRKKVLGWMGNNEDLMLEVKHQSITVIRNRFTYDATIFNALRDKRPVSGESAQVDLKYVQQVTRDSAKSCDFCDYKNFTATDPLGRMESKSTYTCANVFKLDGWHSMAVFKHHDPIHWNLAQLLDTFGVAQEWFKKVYARDPSYVYPILLWDLLPKASSSQVHPHIHLIMTDDEYYAQMQRWVNSATSYAKHYQGSNFFLDVLNIHNALGLTVQHGSAVAFAHLTPRRDHEIVIMSPSGDADFYKLIFAATRAYIDDYKRYCFSLAIMLPPMNQTRNIVPAFARLVTRGSVSSIRSDISSLEIFATPNVNVDPGSVRKTLEKAVKKYLPV